MFSVPGWKVDSTLLKRDVEESRSSKKRKRKEQDAPKAVAALDGAGTGTFNGTFAPADRSTHAEPSQTPTSSGISQHDLKTSKKQKSGTHESQPSHESAEQPVDGTRRKEKRKSRKEGKRDDQGESTARSPSSNVNRAQPNGTSKPNSARSSTPAVPPPPTPAANLTPLQSAMRQKLVSARFRYLNEMLYTTPSNASSSLFDQNPSFFEEYHSGFRQQVSTWPENPIDIFAADLVQRSKIFPKRQGKQRNAAPNPTSSPTLSPLPRSNGVCRVADLGCGDAKLASLMERAKGKHKPEILSFDLQANSPRVTKADIANLPLESGSVNVAIFCLALMGSNWIDFVEEAHRVLHWKGELWIAEIKSRFGRVKQRRVDHSVGNRQKKGKAPSKDEQRRSKEQQGEAEREQLAVQVDGQQAKEETDVGAFVAVLRRRGFALAEDEGGVDVSNKMFVRMRFVKNLPAVKGKNAENSGRQRSGSGPKEKKMAFIDEDEEDEAGVLKPCLYKTR